MNASMPGSIGDAFHSLIAELVHLDIEQTDVEGMIISHSNSHAADADEVRFLVHWSLDHWRQIKADYPDPITEIALEATLPNSVILTGHPDVVSLFREEGKAHVLDYKTGRAPGNYRHQLNAYGYIIIANDPDIDTVRLTQLDVRTSKATTHTMTRAELMDWAQYFSDRLDDKQYRIGDHCGLCPRRGECPRVSEWIRQMAAAFLDDKPDLPEDKREWGPIVKDSWEKAGQLEYALVDFNKGLKALLKETGPLPLPSGEHFGVIEKPRDTIDAGRAYPVVMAKLGISAEEMLAGMTMTKKALGEFSQIKAGGDTEKLRRQNAKKIELSLIGELRATGALQALTSEYVEVLP